MVDVVAADDLPQEDKPQDVDPEPARAVGGCYATWRPRRELDLILVNTVLDAKNLPVADAPKVADILSRIEGPNPRYETLTDPQRGYLLGKCRQLGIKLPPTSERLLPEVKRNQEPEIPEVLKPANLPKQPPRKLAVRVPVILALCLAADRERVLAARDSICGSAPIALPRIQEQYGCAPAIDDQRRVEHAMRAGFPGGVVLLGIGRDGCEAVARRCAPCSQCNGSGVIKPDPKISMGWTGEMSCPSCHGQNSLLRSRLYGVVAVVLVGPVAARRGREAKPGELGAGMRVCLNDLESVRDVARVAQKGEACSDCDGQGWYRGLWNKCDDCGGSGRVFPLRFIVTSHLEEERCPECGGGGGSNAVDTDAGFESCAFCSGTGHPLSCADIASELLSGGGVPAGGLTILSFVTRADHDTNAIRAALNRALG